MDSKALLDRIATVEGASTGADDSPRGTAQPQPGEAGPSSAGPPPPDLREVEQFLIEATMTGIAWGFGMRAAQAGPHWELQEVERGKLQGPVERLAVKWAPKLAQYMPSLALRWKEEVAVAMVLGAMIYARAKVDAELAAAEAAQPKGTPDGGEKGTEG